MQEREGQKGYAAGFDGRCAYINAVLPRSGEIERSLRRNVATYPEIAIRELVANALIHQDFSVTGAGPMIEIFDTRVEITNPGDALVSTDRFLDAVPRSRNEALASMLRRFGICEERGSGVDKVVFATELHQLPAPVFRSTDGSTKATLFAPKSWRDMDRQERVWACDLHASLRCVEGGAMTNSSLRRRFGITTGSIAVASRIIRDTLNDGLIRPQSESQGRKFAKYVPAWA